MCTWHKLHLSMSIFLQYWEKTSKTANRYDEQSEAEKLPLKIRPNSLSVACFKRQHSRVTSWRLHAGFGSKSCVNFKNTSQVFPYPYKMIVQEGCRDFRGGSIQSLPPTSPGSESGTELAEQAGNRNYKSGHSYPKISCKRQCIITSTSWD